MKRMDLFHQAVPVWGQETCWVFPGRRPRLAIPKTALELAQEPDAGKTNKRAESTYGAQWPQVAGPW